MANESAKTASGYKENNPLNLKKFPFLMGNQ
jgi:hypothetical protein